MKNREISTEFQALLSNNLKFLRKTKRFSQEQMAEELNISEGQYQQYELGNRLIPITILMRVASYFHVALDALVKGDLSRTDLEGIFPITNNRLLFPVFIKEGNEQEVIQIVPVKASAGYLTGYGDPSFVEKLPHITLPFLKKGTFRGFTITGDSMLPVISGSMIVGKYVNEIAQIKNGKTYIVVTREGIVYKRLEYDGVTLTLISDNTYYKPYTIPLEEVRELWEFTCLITTEELDKQAYSTDIIYPLISGVYNNMHTLTDDIAEIKRKLYGIQ